MRDHRREIAAGGITGDRKSFRVCTEFLTVRGNPLRRRPHVVDGCRVRVLGRQAIVDRHDESARTDRVVACLPVVGVQVADHPSAAVEEHHDGRCDVGLRRPVQPDGERARGTVDRAVLDAQFGMHGLARQVAEPLPGGVGASLGCQLERHRFQYLLQDGVERCEADCWLVGD